MLRILSQRYSDFAIQIMGNSNADLVRHDRVFLYRVRKEIQLFVRRRSKNRRDASISFKSWAEFILLLHLSLVQVLIMSATESLDHWLKWSWDPDVVDRRRIQVPALTIAFNVRETSTYPTITSRPESLPLELIHYIFSFLDLKSILQVGLLNHHFRSLLHDYRPFKESITRASRLIGAFVTTGLLGYHPIVRIHDVLKTERCSFCAKFGPYIHLLQCERTCQTCLWVLNRFSSGLIGDVESFFPRFVAESKQLPIMHATPRLYEIGQEKCTARMMISSYLSAFEIYRSRVVSQEKQAKSWNPDVSTQDDHLTAYLDSLPSWPFEVVENHGVFADLTSLRLPFLARNDALESGYWCQGCLYMWSDVNRLGVQGAQGLHADSTEDKKDLEDDLWDSAHTAYVAADFIQHCRTCPGLREAKLVLEARVASSEGTEVSILAYLYRTRGV